MIRYNDSHTSGQMYKRDGNLTSSSVECSNNRRMMIRLFEIKHFVIQRVNVKSNDLAENVKRIRSDLQMSLGKSSN